MKNPLCSAVVIALFLCVAGCGPDASDPVGVAEHYIRLQQGNTQAGITKCYGFLSADSRKAASQSEYIEHYQPTHESNGTCWVIDSIGLLSEDHGHPTYRRVRAVVHFEPDYLPDYLGVPTAWYLTLVNEDGRWRVVWELALLDRADEFFHKGMCEEAIALSDRALELNPYSAAAYRRKAWCYSRKQPSGWDESQSRAGLIETNARKALGLEPEQPRYYNVLFHRIWDKTGIGFRESSASFSTFVGLA